MREKLGISVSRVLAAAGGGGQWNSAAVLPFFTKRRFLNYRLSVAINLPPIIEYRSVEKCGERGCLRRLKRRVTELIAGTLNQLKTAKTHLKIN